ncbi:MAG: hypothetical protein ACK5O2_15265 [Microthrixaceae bacterium]
MNTMNTPSTTATTPSPGVRTGLVISAALGAANIAFLFPWVDWGADEPPMGLLMVNCAIGLVSVACAVVAWNTGARKPLRINATALILNAVMVLPGLFISETPPFIRVSSAVGVLGTVAAVVLTLRRGERTPTRVLD